MLPGLAVNLVAADTVLKINKHAFLPAMEYATKQVWGVLGEDPMKTEQELLYARKNIFNPIFDFVDNSLKYAKDAAEKTLGVDLDRDGLIGQAETSDPQGVTVSQGKIAASQVVKATDSDKPLDREPVKLTVNMDQARAPGPRVGEQGNGTFVAAMPKQKTKKQIKQESIAPEVVPNELQQVAMSMNTAGGSGTFVKYVPKQKQIEKKYD